MKLHAGPRLQDVLANWKQNVDPEAETRLLGERDVVDKDAGVHPALVMVAEQSLGKCPVSPHQKQVGMPPHGGREGT